MLCYRCGGQVKDGSEKCASCGQQFALGLKPGAPAGFGTGSRRHRVAVEGAPFKVGETVAGRFLITEQIGAGPLGWMYCAVESNSEIEMALKILSPRFLQLPEEKRAFSSGMARAKGLSHPNIARFYGAGEDGDRPWMAHQFLEGLTLRRIMELRRQKGQGLALREVEPIVAQIAAALDSARFAHGNLKPDNVMVLPDLLKLTDFGLPGSLPRAPFMAAQKAFGVHRYLAPEFLMGEPLDSRSDVFSLGVMLGEMLSGVASDAPLEPLARNPALPSGIQAIFRRAIAPRASERFASAGDLAAELTALLDAPLAERAPPVEDDLFVEEARTDPRLRIARALAEQDAAPGKVAMPAPAPAPLPPVPLAAPPVARRTEPQPVARVPLPPSAPPPPFRPARFEPRPVETPQKAQLAAVASAQVRSAPTAPPEVPLAEGNGEPAGDPAEANSRPRRGAGKRNKQQKPRRGRRGAADPTRTTPAEGALAIGPATSPLQPLEPKPRPGERVTLTQAPSHPAAEPVKPAAAGPAAAPSFGQPVEKKRKVSVALLAVGGLVLALLLIATLSWLNRKLPPPAAKPAPTPAPAPAAR